MKHQISSDTAIYPKAITIDNGRTGNLRIEVTGYQIDNSPDIDHLLNPRIRRKLARGRRWQRTLPWVTWIGVLSFAVAAIAAAVSANINKSAGTTWWAWAFVICAVATGYLASVISEDITVFRHEYRDRFHEVCSRFWTTQAVFIAKGSVLVQLFDIKDETKLSEDALRTLRDIARQTQGLSAPEAALLAVDFTPVPWSGPHISKSVALDILNEEVRHICVQQDELRSRAEEVISVIDRLEKEE